MTCQDVYKLNLDEYLNYSKHLPFDEQQKFIKIYLDWYYSVDDSDSFIKSIVKRQDFEYENVILSPNGMKIATIDMLKFVTVYDVLSNQEIAKFRRKNAYNFAFSYDSLKLAFLTENTKITIFSINTNSFEETYEEIQGYIMSYHFSKSDYTIALKDRPNSIKILKNFKLFIQKKEFKQIYLYEFTSKFPELLCYSVGKSFLVWNFLSDQILSKIETESDIDQLFFTDSASIIGTASDKIIKLYFFSKGEMTVYPNYANVQKMVSLSGHTDSIRKIVISTDEKFVLSSQLSDGFIIFYLWTAKKEDDEYQPEITKFDYYFHDYMWCKDKFIAIDYCKEIHYFDPLLPIQIKKDLTKFGNGMYSPKQGLLVLRVSDRKFALIEEKTGLMIKMGTLENKEEENIPIRNMYFSNDGLTLVIQTNKFLYKYNVKGTSLDLESNPISLNAISPSALKVSNKGNIIMGYENGEISCYLEKNRIMNSLEKAHQHIINCFAFDLNEEIMVSGDKNGNVYFWDKNLKIIKENEIKSDDENNGINFLLFSQIRSQILFVLYQTKLSKYDIQQKIIIETIEFPSELKENKSFESKLTLSKNEKMIYVNVFQHNILILKEINQKLQIVRKLFGIDEVLLEIQPDPSDQNIFICKCPRTIFHIQNDFEKSSFKLQNEIKFVNDKTIMSCSNEGKTLEFFSSLTGTPLFKQIAESSNSSYDFLLSADEKYLLVKDFKEYWVWDLEKGIIVEKNKETEAGWIYQVPAARQKYHEDFLAFTKNSQIFVWSNRQPPFQKKYEIKEEILYLDYSFDDKKLLVTCKERVFLLDTTDYQKEKNEIIFQENILVKKGLFSYSDYTFFLLFEESPKNKIQVYNGVNMSLMNEIKCSYENFQNFFISPSNIIFLQFSGKLCIINPWEKQEKIINSRKGIYYYMNKKGDLYLYTENNMEVYYNVLQNLSFFMDNRDNIKGLQENMSKEDGKIENFEHVLCPFHLNPLQIYAYDNKRVIERNLFEINDLPIKMFFSQEIHQRTVFDIVSQTQEIKLFVDFLTYILKKSSMKELTSLPEGHIFDTKFFTLLMGMFEDSPDLIISFLEFIFAEPLNFPSNFSQKSLKTPILIEKDSASLTQEEINKIFMENKGNLNEGAVMKEIVRAKCLYVNSFLDYNNQDTIDVFKGICDFEATNPIFSHIALIKILEFKWQTYARRQYFIEALNFLIFLILYIVNADYFLIERLKNEDSIQYIYSLVLDVIILCFAIHHVYGEIQQFIALKLKYFSSLWNIIDVILITLILLTTVLDILSCFQIWHYSTILKSFDSVTIFFGYIRILSYARGIEGSSFMIKLIIEVMYDIRYFLFLMFIFVIALTSSG